MTGAIPLLGKTNDDLHKRLTAKVTVLNVQSRLGGALHKMVGIEDMEANKKIAQWSATNQEVSKAINYLETSPEAVCGSGADPKSIMQSLMRWRQVQQEDVKTVFQGAVDTMQVEAKELADLTPEWKRL